MKLKMLSTTLTGHDALSCISCVCVCIFSGITELPKTYQDYEHCYSKLQLDLMSHLSYWPKLTGRKS